MSKIRELTVVTDGYGDDCIYVNGERRDELCELTVNVSDLIAASNGEPFVLRAESANPVLDEWPKQLSDALRGQDKSEQI